MGFKYSFQVWKRIAEGLKILENAEIQIFLSGLETEIIFQQELNGFPDSNIPFRSGNME